jgi:tRNA(adenine34) deaminase
VIVSDGRVVAAGHNRREIDADPVSHAELLAIREAARKLGRWRLAGCTLYVTLEPCVMCAGAIVLARLDRVVYGAADPKAGAVESLYRVLADERLNHRPVVTTGVMGEECSRMLSEFFRRKRAEKDSE